MKLFYGIVLFAFTLYPIDASAQIDGDSEISVFAETCEKIINDESKASARVRASDKASFLAVENIPELSEYKQRLDSHNFNLKIYKLVDNYLEDIKITVTQQTSDKVCVEVSAYLPTSSISEIFTDEFTTNNITNETYNAEEEFVLDIENIEKEITISIPPKPEIVINKNIAYQESENIDNKENFSKEYINTNITNNDLPKVTKIYVDKTEFYNGVTTGGFFATIEQELLSKSGIKVIASKNNPDYILKTKILKARVDNVNSETGRLQLVVSLDLTDTETDKTITEHQNRFILFNLSEDNQKVAASLAKKLFIEGIAKLLPKIKTANFKSIITPN